MRIGFKLIFYCVIIALAGLVGYAIFSDLPAPTREVSLPVEAE